jgi:hypothetical protein
MEFDFERKDPLSERYFEPEGGYRREGRSSKAFRDSIGTVGCVPGMPPITMPITAITIDSGIEVSAVTAGICKALMSNVAFVRYSP